MGVWDYIQAVAVIGVVIYAAYYVTRLVARAGGPVRKNAHIKLISSLPLARDKSVAVVALGEHAYVLGVGAHSVQLLDKLPLSELRLAEEAQAPAPEFAEGFKRVLSERLKKLRK